MSLTKDEILASRDALPDIKVVNVPEWGGNVCVRVMSGKDRERFESCIAKPDGQLRARLAALCVCDMAGKLLFNESDLQALGEKSSKALNRIYNAAVKLNALRDDDIEDMEKNSDPAT